MENLKDIIESLVFVSAPPLSVNRLAAILEDVEPRDIRLALAELQGEYDDRQGGFILQEVAGGVQFRTRARYSDWIKKLLKPSPTRLSRAALETLAIIAYKQPIIRADVEHIRGVDCGGVLRMLLERKLIRVLGRKDIPGRPMIYGTTKEFLEIFNLKDLSELPSPKEIMSLGTAEDDDEIQADNSDALTVLATDTALPEDVSRETVKPVEAIPESSNNVVPPDATDDEATQPVETLADSGDQAQASAVGFGDGKNPSHFETATPADTQAPDRAPADETLGTPALQPATSDIDGTDVAEVTPGNDLKNALPTGKNACLQIGLLPINTPRVLLSGMKGKGGEES
ncbi:MAG: SMC-Scp complex subunit ScpB [Desulfosarcina sp.]|nr:SMC-Scp complex subunit ScpB [Desulfobacterales bacterium]